MYQTEIRLNDTAVLKAFIPKDDFDGRPHGSPRPALLVIPGGGYARVSDREDEPVMLPFLAHGYCVFSLRYSVGKNAVFPRPLIEAARAMYEIRSHAAEWNLDPARVFALGFSAGGHLTASLGTFWDLPEVIAGAGIPQGSDRPTGIVLCYPVITSGEHAHKGSFYHLLGTDTPDEAALARWSVEKHISEKNPPAFFFHSSDDAGVPVENTLLAASAYAAKRIPFEVHIYPNAPHGSSLCNKLTACGVPGFINARMARWVEDAYEWMETLPSLTDLPVIS